MIRAKKSCMLEPIDCKEWGQFQIKHQLVCAFLPTFAAFKQSANCWQMTAWRGKIRLPPFTHFSKRSFRYLRWILDHSFPALTRWQRQSRLFESPRKAILTQVDLCAYLHHLLKAKPPAESMSSLLIKPLICPTDEEVALDVKRSIQKWSCICSPSRFSKESVVRRVGSNLSSSFHHLGFR